MLRKEWLMRTSGFLFKKEERGINQIIPHTEVWGLNKVIPHTLVWGFMQTLIGGD
jgi:hypothetical protein